MSVSLAWMVERLRAAAPARNDVPDALQYEECAREAVGDFSHRKPVQRIATLNITPGLATYALPVDFLKLITLESVTTADGVILSDAGIVPMSSTWRERWVVAGRTITFYPTPTYSMSRDLWYAAGHILDADLAYPDLSDEEARIVLLRAQAGVLQLQANVVADGWKYQVADEMVDKTGQGKGLGAQAAELERRYESAIRAANGPVGLRG